MTTDTAAPSYTGFRFPQEIISHVVWLYFRFNLSFRDVEELLAARGVVVIYETVREWCKKFGQQFAKQLRRRRAQPGDKWHADEVFLKINGKTHYLWRRRSSWQRPGYPRTESSEQASSHQVLSQAPEGVHLFHVRAHHRQTPELWCRQTCRPAERGASPKSLSQQPRRGLASIHTQARAGPAALQVGRTCPTVLVCLRADSSAFLSRTASVEGGGVPAGTRTPIPSLERSNGPPTGSITVSHAG